MKPDFASAEITVACLSWLRFGRQLSYVASEYDVWAGKRADVFGANERESVEVEVKVSRMDLLRDFERKPWKHDRYREGSRGAMGARTPNRVYFAVPLRLKDAALEVLAKEAPTYGLITLGEDEHGYYAELPWKRLRVVRSAKWLHRDPPAKSLIEDLTHRMASEVATFHIAALRWGGFFAHVKDEIERHHSARPLVPEAIDDPKLEDLLPKELPLR